MQSSLSKHRWEQKLSYSGFLDDILCEQHERVVTKDNTVSFEGRTLQIPSDQFRHHYVKTRVRVYRDISGKLAIFHRPRKLAEFPTVQKAINAWQNYQ